MHVRLYGSGRWAPGWETAGMSACCLSSASCWWVLCSLWSDCAGQGAHREVGSEGFEANRRAVAKVLGEPVGQIQVIPSLHYGGEGSSWGAWAQQGVCGRHGGKATCVTPGGLVRSRLTGSGTWACKPFGEVRRGSCARSRSDSRYSGTGEEQKPRDRLLVGRRDGDPKASFRGKGSRWAGQVGWRVG